MKKLISITSLITAILICTTVCGNAFATSSETDTAVDYLLQQGIYVGDESGNLNLDEGLSRVELAVILTRLDFMPAPYEWEQWGIERFSNPETRYNTFTDIPGWALPYIEYCYQRNLMVGVGDNLFDPQGKVNPKMAATVILRYCGINKADWSYQTSVSTAQSLGIAPNGGMSGDTVLRSTMAVTIYNGILYDQARAQVLTPIEPIEQPTAAPQEPDPAQQAPTMTIDEMKAELVRLTNIERVKAGVPELAVLPELMNCAQAKAQDMIISGYYGHNSPTYGTHNEMIRAYVSGVNGGWENTTFGGESSPSVILQAWLASTGHRANILEDRTTHIGIGIAQDQNGKYAWVQQFVKLG